MAAATALRGGGDGVVVRRGQPDLGAVAHIHLQGYRFTAGLHDGIGNRLHFGLSQAGNDGGGSAPRCRAPSP